MSPEVKLLPNRWLEPDRQALGVEIARDDSGLKLMRGPERFYWLETRTTEGHFVSARKDLCLTEAEFSETLAKSVAMYRRSPWAADEYVANYKLAAGAQKLITAGYQDAIKHEQSSFLAHLRKVTAVGVVASLTVVVFSGELTHQAAIIYLAAAGFAWATRAAKISRELKNSEVILKSATASGD